ncbi:hypothetical protein FHS39_000825 [Streptomyces olivoverticillatus]|uniref:Uncharacterized protein n=1 Tax=Streptomyces olivoverticillatus TaxID=66427 RepID=A0A7W7LKD1_9ACTN|nr:hypothetical protein [Streptomyces olivoverticillatus]MBB4891825.1 hypothetical protein [Streptomyces olivoverticillatus]
MSGGPGAGADSEATAFLPHMGGSAGRDAEATAFIPPMSGGTAEAATAFMSPVGGGGLPADAPAPPVGLGTAPSGERPPPAEFDTLFRAAEPTQQLPPVPAGQSAVPGPPPGRRGPQPPAPGSVPPPSSGFGAQPPAPGGHGGPARRKKSPAVLIAAVVAGCAVAGLGAGALLSGGGDDTSSQQPAATGSTAPNAPKGDDGQQPETAKPADPAEAQAKALDALLKDSNNSRDAVIKAVDATRSCKDLGKSASDLRDAAGQRNGLVSRLDQTAIDKLPGHDDLKAQLTKAWQSSASADSHYASWADQVGGKHGCIKGHARPSRDSVAGDQASGQATDAKKKAADLWSPIAKKYGLTAHDWTQL